MKKKRGGKKRQHCQLSVSLNCQIMSLKNSELLQRMGWVFLYVINMLDEHKRALGFCKIVRKDATVRNPDAC